MKNNEDNGDKKMLIYVKLCESRTYELTFAVHLLSIRVRAKRFRGVHQLVQLRLFLSQFS